MATCAAAGTAGAILTVGEYVAAQHADDLAHVNDDAARVMRRPTLRRPTPGRCGVQRVPCFQPNDPGPGDSGRRN